MKAWLSVGRSGAYIGPDAVELRDVALTGDEYSEQLQYVAAGRAKSRSLAPFRKLLPFLRPYRARIVLATLALMLSSAVTLVLPALLRRLIDHAFTAGDLARLSQYFLVFLAGAALLGIASAVRFYFVTWIGERVVADLRRAVFDHLMALTPAFFEATRTGEILSRLTADTTLIQTVVGSSVSVAMRNAVMFAGGLALMAATSPMLTGLVVAAVLLVMIPLLLFGRWVRTLSRRSQDRLADTSAIASETLYAMQTVQAFSHEDLDRKAFARVVESAFAAAVLRTRARAVMTAVVTFAGFACVVGVFWAGTRAVNAHAMTAGQLVQFILYAGIVAGGVGVLSEIWSDMQRAAGASERLMELLHTPPQIAPPLRPAALAQPARGAIDFRAVTFRYPARPDFAALNRFDLAVAPGEAVALVGPSGAGKSTVFQLLLRFYAPQEGAITFDGVDITALDPSALRRNIAIVAQDPVIFSGTLAENIRYGRPEARDDEVRAAAEAAAASEFIDRLADGLATPVGERGVTLSGGQKQRIAIARAFLRNAPLLLLDEATSALDSESERLVQTGIANLMSGRTTLIIAHRLATIQRLGRIVVMEEGRVVAEGTHSELVGKGGLYARLADLQFASSLALAG
ncbi:MAG: ATP-binding cassette domain-containing protein [Alphaproteobacteria bacterium]|nr:ATP-binding cassette domain-containing protein [Alphaproteobacteria bacterium]